MYPKKFLDDLHTLENKRHNLNRKIRNILNTSAYVIWGDGRDGLWELDHQKSKVVREIGKLRLKLKRLSA